MLIKNSLIVKEKICQSLAGERKREDEKKEREIVWTNVRKSKKELDREEKKKRVRREEADWEKMWTK